MNSMLWLYVISLIPAIIGFGLYLRNNEIHLGEWIIGTIVAFLISGIMQVAAYFGQIHDVEIWSGQVTYANHYPFWVETYEHAVYDTEWYTTTDMDGNMVSATREVFSHYETRYRDHNQYFEKDVSFGVIAKRFRISQTEFKRVVDLFGGDIKTVKQNKSGFYSGDPNIYQCKNTTKNVIPAAIVKSWSNKVKASPSSFSFPKVPKDAPLYEYPSCLDTWHSDRLLGDAGVKIDTLEFDKLNAYLGPRKKVNIIIVGFVSADSNLGKLQEAKWIGGKKNDVVICYGYAPLEGNVPNVCWTYCFSWCKNDQMKRNIEEIFKYDKIDNSILPKLKDEIVKGYTKRDWSDLDSLKVKPRFIHYKILLGVMFIVQTILYIIFMCNGYKRW